MIWEWTVSIAVVAVWVYEVNVAMEWLDKRAGGNWPRTHGRGTR